jgi:hypothetical protein
MDRSWQDSDLHACRVPSSERIPSPFRRSIGVREVTRRIRRLDLGPEEHQLPTGVLKKKRLRSNPWLSLSASPPAPPRGAGEENGTPYSVLPEMDAGCQPATSSLPLHQIEITRRHCYLRVVRRTCVQRPPPCNIQRRERGEYTVDTNAIVTYALTFRHSTSKPHHPPKVTSSSLPRFLLRAVSI